MNHPLILTFEYDVSVILSHLILENPSNPTFNSDKFTLNPNPLVVLPFAREP